MTAIPQTRDISEADMRALLEARRIAREKYDGHIAKKSHVYNGLDAAYAAKLAILWDDLVETSNALNEAGI